MSAYQPIALPPTLAYLMGVPVAPREAIESVLQRAIDELDSLDGDPDLEPNGDELDGTGAEDDFVDRSDLRAGPGCPIADPDLAADDVGCDTEWDDREEEEGIMFPSYGADQTQPCSSVAEQERADRAIMRPHRNLIRRERCNKAGRYFGGLWYEFRLRS